MSPSAAAARVPAGIPTGGQFTHTLHTEPALALVPDAPPAEVIYDGDISELSPELASRVESWQGKLQDAGISGKISHPELEGGVDLLRATLTEPSGLEFGFQGDSDSLDIWRNDDNVDRAHLGVSDLYREAGTADGLSPKQLAAAFDEARTNAVIADSWAAQSSLRSNENISFWLPEVNEDGHGEMEIEFTHGSTFRIVVPRGSDSAIVYNSSDEELSPRMTQAILADAAETAGGKPDTQALIHSMTRSLEPVIEGTW